MNQQAKTTSDTEGLGLIRQVLDGNEALDLIQRVFDGNEWDSSATDRVTDIVRMTGREIAEPGIYTREELIEMIRDDHMDAISHDDRGFIDLMNAGFKGFDNMSYSELLKDARDNNLIDGD